MKPLDKIRLNSPTLLQGSIIVQHLLRFDDHILKKIVGSIVATDKNELMKWALDVSASHVFEKAMLSPKLTPSEKFTMIKAFRGQFCDLAKDKFGSHIIDKFWAVADLGTKVSYPLKRPVD